MSDRVAITVSSHVAHMTLTRADKMNALDPDLSFCRRAAKHVDQ